MFSRLPVTRVEFQCVEYRRITPNDVSYMGGVNVPKALKLISDTDLPD